MKKILSLITVAAIMLTSFATVVFAAEGTYGLDTAIANSSVTCTENFQYVSTWSPNCVAMDYRPANANFIGRKEIASGLGGLYYYASETLDDESVNKYAKTYNLYYKIPEFFKDKEVGTEYTITFRAKFVGDDDRNNTNNLGHVGKTDDDKDTTTKNLAVCAINVGDSVNKGSVQNYSIKYGVVTQDNTDWATYTVKFTYNGVTDFTDSANEEVYDKYALCLRIYTDTYQLNGSWRFPYYAIDDLTITSPTLTGINKTTFAGSNITVNNKVYNNDAKAQNGKVINAIYDNAGNLKTVASADLAIAANETSKEVPVTLKVPSNVASDWTYKSMVWADLNDTIEPLTAHADLFDDNLFENGSFEIWPKTTAVGTYGNDNVAKGWTTGSGSSNGGVDTTGVVAVTNCEWGDSSSAKPHTGNYAVKLPKLNAFLSTNLSSPTEGWVSIIKANGPGTYHLSFWAIIPVGSLYFGTAMNGGIEPKVYKKGTTTPISGVYASEGIYTEKEGNWCKYEVDVVVTSTSGNNNNWSYLRVYPTQLCTQPVFIDDMRLTFTPAQ